MIPSNDVIPIVPKTFLCKFSNLLNDIYEDFECDRIEPRKTYYLQCFDIIKKRTIELFNNKLFWELNMNYDYCDHFYKSGPMAYTFCGRKIEIVTDDGKKHFKCAKHISKKYYIPKKVRDENLLCKSNNKYGDRCNKYKHYDDYCITHYAKIHNIDNLKHVDKIYKEKKNNIIFNEEIITLFNIDEEIFNYEINNNKLNHIPENIIIDNEITYYVKDMLNIELNLEIYFENDKINNIINYIDEDINKIQKDKTNIHDFINKCEKVLNNNYSENFNLNILDIKNSYEVITNIIENKTYINITYLTNSLNNYNMKFKNFKKEIHNDFPNYYKRLKGYFDLIEQELDYDIIRNIEMAKLKSKFI